MQKLSDQAIDKNMRYSVAGEAVRAQSLGGREDVGKSYWESKLQFVKQRTRHVLAFSRRSDALWWVGVASWADTWWRGSRREAIK